MVPLLWIDVETTGLDEFSHVLLEVGLAATDEDLKIQDSFAVVIHQPEEVIGHGSKVAIKMHEENGLLDEVRESKTSILEAERLLVDWSQKYAGRQMSGSTVHFDRTWLKLWMPDLIDLFHYRNFDVRTLRTFFDVKPVKTSNHRALDDIRDDISTTRWISEHVSLDAEQEVVQ